MSESAGRGPGRHAVVLAVVPVALLAMARLPPLILLTSSLMCGLLAILLDLAKEPRHAVLPFFFLGVAAPLAPLGGSGVLLPLILAVVALWSRDVTFRSVAWALPFLAVAGSQVVAELLAEISRISLPIVMLRLGQEGLPFLAGGVASYELSQPRVALAILDLARLAAIPALMAILTAQPDRLGALRRGLLAGLVPAAVLTAGILAGLLPDGLPNQSVYWSKLGRASGTFTDPNAFGVFVILALPLLIESARAHVGLLRLAGFAFAAAWLVLAAFSGSRTFFLGLVVYLFLAAARGGWRLLAPLSLAAAGLAAGLNVEPVGDAVRAAVEPVAPVGIVRMLGSVSVEQLDRTLESRRIFWSIALEAFREHPVLGIGFSRFPGEAPWIALALGHQLRGFTDNPNSFYLGILAEMGIVGAAAFVLSMALLRKRPEAGVAWTSVLVLAAILALGPHTQFDEIALLVAFLLASSVAPREIVRGVKGGGVTLVVAGGVLVLAGLPTVRGSVWGFHKPEKDALGRYFQWASDVAESTIRAPDGPVLEMGLSDGISGRRPPSPLLVDVFVNGRSVGTVQPPFRRWQRFSWYLPELPPGAPRRVRLVSSRPFRPALLRKGRPDWRLLGVAVRGIGFGPLQQGGVYGFYPWERSWNRQCRWAIGRRGAIVMPEAGRTARLKLFTLDPETFRRPMKVVVRAAGGAEVTAHLPMRRPVFVDVPLPSATELAIVEMEADRTFRAGRAILGDPRELSFGIQGWSVVP